MKHIKDKIQNLLSYQSDALHWNLEQIDNIPKIAEKAFRAYKRIAKDLKVEMHSFDSARRRIEALHRGKTKFMQLSREHARKAQIRESTTMQPKEYLTGNKAMITIKNYLGGCYFFTCDEVEVHRNKLYLVEGKHTRTGILPSQGDIKDGLIKMILFTNLEKVTVGKRKYKPIPVLKLTARRAFK